MYENEAKRAKDVAGIYMHSLNSYEALSMNFIPTHNIQG